MEVYTYVLTKPTRAVYDGKKIDFNAKIKKIWLALEKLNFDWLDFEKLWTQNFSKYLIIKYYMNYEMFFGLGDKSNPVTRDQRRKI